jgi:hypothetical protein
MHVCQAIALVLASVAAAAHSALGQAIAGTERSIPILTPRFITISADV